jgi:hypothetical protein
MNLHELFATLTVEEREALARKVPTEAGYLWQLSKQWRGKKPSLGLMQKLVAAEPRLTLAELVEEFAGAESHGTANGKSRKPSKQQPSPTDKPTRGKGR